jgi:transcriptional regulator with XRE-family HTH domain
MAEAVGKLLHEELARSGKSLRKAAAEIGISHTTLRRIIGGDTFDYSTAQKLAAWLEIPVSTLVDLGGSGTDALAAQIAAVLHQEPRLAEIFARAMEKVLAGQMSQDSVRELLAYAAFRLNTISGEE